MDYDRDDGPAMYALPTPSDTPYRTPTISRSRNATPSLEFPSSPPTFMSDTATPHSRSTSPEATKDNISPLDPRRFTPTLHASLVGEILALRRELESKNKDIGHLEDTLHHTKAQNDELNTNLTQTTKESRHLRKQMELLEGGTLSALDEIAKERDEANGNVSELRKRLEKSQKEARSYEEDVHRAQQQYEGDKSAWEADRRALETKVHIVEGRLKVVLSEVAASQEMVEHQHPPPSPVNGRRSAADGSVRSESAASMRPKKWFGRRRASTASSGIQESPRHKNQHSIDGPVPKTVGGLSLADELDFSDDAVDDYLADEDDEDFQGRNSDPRPASAQSRQHDLKARKVLGLSTEVRQLDPIELQRLSLLEEESDRTLISAAQYIDTATQYSPPASPGLSPVAEEASYIGDEMELLETHPSMQSISSATTELQEIQSPQPSKLRPINMISTSSQTGRDLPSPPTPPTTPKLLNAGDAQLKLSKKDAVELVSRETQTETSTIPQFPFLASPGPIPQIAIHPPTSRPGTREGVVLPPLSKSAASQVDPSELVDVRSVGVQTTGIRVDKRPVQLTEDQDNSPMMPQSPEQDSKKHPRLRSPPPVAANMSAVRAAEARAKSKAHPIPNNDTELVTKDNVRDIRRPERSSSLFAGFDEEDDRDDGADAKEPFDDDEDIFNRPMISFTLKDGKAVKASILPSDGIRLESDDIDPLEANEDAEFDEEKEEFVVPPRPTSRRPKPLRLASDSIRRSAMISSGTAAHQATSRARSPSLPTSAAPPFPVPTRYSSRKVPLSASEGAHSPTREVNRRLSYDDEINLRKTRSAATIPQREQHRGASPPPLSSSTIPESPPQPPMPHDEVSASGSYHAFRSPDPNRWSSHWSSHEREASVANSSTTAATQPTVVDAIAQTMVGEWMWKYVRRGKSFAPPEIKHPDWERSGDELSQSVSPGGARHRRWVWLAPYERAVLWSSKQPTSGPALLGKAGRKREFGSSCALMTLVLTVEP